jgi:hypothetical protein
VETTTLQTIPIPRVEGEAGDRRAQVIKSMLRYLGDGIG